MQSSTKKRPAYALPKMESLAKQKHGHGHFRQPREHWSNISSYIYLSRFASYSLCFLDHIWYSLEHTGNARTYGVSLEHTRITPRTYQEATNDYTGIGIRVIPGYTRILAQGIVIGYAKTPLDCPLMPSRKKTVDNFLGNEHALGSLSQDIRNIQRISAR